MPVSCVPRPASRAPYPVAVLGVRARRVAEIMVRLVRLALVNAFRVVVGDVRIVFLAVLMLRQRFDAGDQSLPVAFRPAPIEVGRIQFVVFAQPLAECAFAVRVRRPPRPWRLAARRSGRRPRRGRKGRKTCCASACGARGIVTGMQSPDRGRVAMARSFRVVVRADARAATLASARPFCHQEGTMSNVSDAKKIGRPATGIGTPITVRLAPDALAALDVWRKEQNDAPSRPEAVRRLLATAL